MNTLRLTVVSAIALLAACSDGSIATKGSAETNTAPATAATTAPDKPNKTAAAAAHGLPDFTSLVRRYGDAVVNVRFSTSNITSGAAEVMAYGTAVLVE